MKHLTKQQLGGHLPPISQSIYEEQDILDTARESKNDLQSGTILQTPAHGHLSVSPSAKTYIDPICVDTGCRLNEL